MWCPLLEWWNKEKMLYGFSSNKKGSSCISLWIDKKKLPHKSKGLSLVSGHDILSQENKEIGNMSKKSS